MADPDTPAGTDLATAPPPASAVAAPIVCANCGTAYAGNFCPECGQSAKTPLRHLPALAEDAMDLAFNLDGRILHTLPPLLLRPGFLSNEYFAGRRVRYIPPFRLMFVLSVLAFLLLRLAIDAGTGSGLKVGVQSDIDTADTPAEVHERLQSALDGLAMARLATGGVGAQGFDKAEAELRDRATRRLDELGAAPGPGRAGSTSVPVLPSALSPASTASVSPAGATSAAGPPPPVDVSRDDSRVGRITQQIKDRFTAAARDPRQRQQLVAGFFRVLPQCMLVLLPLFALLLKFAYIFKRRLYIEHLIVAMHSHAFMFLLLLLMSGAWLASDAWPVLSGAFGYFAAALWIWLPLYLLLMQKRVYRQGWFFTLLKYIVLGLCYVILLTFALAAAAIIGATTA